MDAPLDLYRASREELIAVVLRQREQIADLEQRLARPRGGAGHAAGDHQPAHGTRWRCCWPLRDPSLGDEPPGHPSGMPGLKPTERRATPAAPPPPRKRRARGYGRQRMRPTARQVHAFTHCPHCRGRRCAAGRAAHAAKSSSWCRPGWM